MNPDFNDFCRALCEVAGCPMPEAAINDAGAAAIAFDVRGVEITVGHDPARADPLAFTVARFGPLPQERTLEACMALLETNAHMSGDNAPSFALDPATHDVLLVSARPMRATPPQSAYQAMVQLADIAVEWRDGHFLRADAAATGAGPTPLTRQSA
ncbi:MAG: hypothetical protein KA335_06980 [Ramlibacter sp.]|jgi:hypothetical protein|nr:hypothetical protein [Ramlibacter sp.]